ncbi:NADH-quinone oxidoreductase subunit J [Actinoplanes friuliensis]|uniref:NADH-quinone oxidoreductase subunit J n=1 Tax=Actinoplanes friuliensis DSM 7358 TaxID=1246995 RepID=U5VPB1_9ACTN|nr:NADH-quinone oxidoreductase subunit J [Actinoplanes friuliensis]AGZ38629.1 NADH:ubiquinone oxidoreductase subunit J [Actinoplanes friuliensis DSM 7358]
MISIAAEAAGQVSTGEAWGFWILGSLAVIGALGMVVARNAVHSALWLVVTMLCLGFIYVINQAPFLGAVQIIVYTGAIMMLFLFVLMLVGRDASDSLIETLRGQRIAAILLGVAFGVLVATGLARSLGGTEVVGLAEANAAGNVQGIARLLFTKYVFAFEVTSALLITAAVGAMVLAHVEQAKEDIADQVTRMKARFRPGSYPGPKAGPGVYANTMSVAVPARLPDGNGSERSISPILPVRELTSSEAAPKRTEK